MSPTGTIFDIRAFSLHDGPGIRTAVFFKGCPLRCAWSHNPESQRRQPELMLHPRRCIGCQTCVEACPQSAIRMLHGAPVTQREICQACGACVDVCYADSRQIAGRAYTVAEVMAVVERERLFAEASGGGVAFSGGEPLMQVKFLLALLQAAKQAGLHTAVDTCGYAPWRAFERILPFTDVFLYDLKLMDSESHRRYTGVSNERILDNLRRLSRMGRPLILRVPLIPGVNDSQQELQALGAFAAGLPSLQRIDLLPYHNSAESKYHGLGRDYPLPEISTPSEQHMQASAGLLQEAGLNVQIGG